MNKLSFTFGALAQASRWLKSGVICCLGLTVFLCESFAEEFPSEEFHRPFSYQPLRNFKEGLGLLLDRRNQVTLAVGVASITAATQLDHEAHNYFYRRRRLGDWDQLGNHYLGTGVPGTIMGASFWLFGELLGNSYEVHAGQAQLEALLVTGILTAALKGAARRERPDHSDRLSFPSGHTSTVFTSATVLHEFYGWKLGFPGFFLAALTAASRMSEGRHWLSDTVGGATLGILVGHAFARMHLDRIETKSKIASKRKYSIHPVIHSDGGQLLVHVEF